MEITNYIGKAIAYYREQKEWSTVQLAEESGLSQGSISLYENGKRNPSDDALERICSALGITLKTLKERAEHLAVQSYNKVSESRKESYGVRNSINKARHIERIYRFNDFVFELNEDILISIKTNVHDVANLAEYSGRGAVRGLKSGAMSHDRKSLIAHLTEKVFNEFIASNLDEISYRIEDELHHLNIDAYQLVDELKRR